MCAAALSACGAAPVQVQPPEQEGSEVAVCRKVLDELPQHLDAGERRAVSPDAAAAAAWGDPAVILRCGVEEPPALRPTSRCTVINGVGWFAEKAERGYVFTTVGRAVDVEVRVPSTYAPEAATLVDLASAVKQAPEREPCL